MTALAFADGFYQADSLTSMNMVCQNMYPKYVDLGNGELFPRLQYTPGFNSLLSVGVSTDTNRGLHEVGDSAYSVNGNGLYLLDIGSPFPSGTFLGTISGTSQVSMADNGSQLIVIDPGSNNGYIYNQDTSTFSKITDPGFTANGTPQYVVFIDGYFMVSTDTNRFIVSALRDGTTWNALDFGSAESDPDSIVGLINYKNEAYIFGTQTCEAFQNIGGAGFPFQRNGLILDKGLSYPLSVVQAANTFMWIGSSSEEQDAVYQLLGNQAVKISNTAIELLINQAQGFLEPQQRRNVRGYSYMEDGSFFVCWNLPEVTICYDIYTQKWHTRTSRIDTGNTEVDLAWRCINIIQRPNGQLLSGDLYTNSINQVSRLTPNEGGTLIHRLFDARPIRVEKRAFSIPLIELTMETGTQQNIIPEKVVEMSISRDAFNFGAARAREAGDVGQFRRRIRWRRNGTFTDYGQFRFRTTDPITVVGLDAEFRVGRG